MAEDLQPVPYESLIAGDQKCGSDYLDFFANLQTVVSSTARRILAVAVAGQSAAILPTAIPTGSIKTGQYRLSYYLTLQQAATVSSSVQLTLTWVDGGVTKTQTVAALVANSTGAVQAASFPIDADSPGVLTYSVAYASVGGVPAVFKLRIVVEAL